MASDLAGRFAPLLLAVALVAAALSVSWAPPASAEHTGTRTVWSATLTAESVGTDETGYISSGFAGTLSDNSFTYDRVNYVIKDLFVDPSVGDGRFSFGFTSTPTNLKSSALKLNVGNSLSDLRQFALADATISGNDLRWSNTNLSWEEGDTVRLWLTVDLSLIDPLPTMTASISGDPVEGGEAVTLTLTLSEPVEQATSMQRRVGGTAAHYTPHPNSGRGSDNPAPGTPGDYDWITIPTFAAGATTATTQIRAVQDNEVEGCETITWVMTMWPGTYRAVRTPYTIYIEDDDGGTPCSVLRAQPVLESPTDYVVPGYTKPDGSPGTAGDGAAQAPPEPVLSDFVRQYDANGNNLIDLLEYAQAGQDYGNKRITFEQFTEVKDAWRAGEEHAAQIKELANRAPTVETAFDDITLVSRGDSRQISTSGRFSDPDGHTITMIEAASSAQNVASVAMASDDSSLTVTAKSRGTATITVTAHDGHNGRVSDTFTVTVKAAPTVVSPIADVFEPAVGGGAEVDLSKVFADPDGDPLTYSASTTNEDISVGYINGARMLLLALGRGSVTITVTARDSDGNTVSDSFTVTVKEAPTVANAIADISSLKSGASKKISLSGVFADADGDALTLSAASSDTDVAGVSSQLDPQTASATAITVLAVSSGTATITVTAQDTDGNQVTDTFDVTVPAAQQQKANSAPTVASALSDATIVKIGGTHEVTLSSVFSDADADDTLTITAESSKTSVATVAVASDGSKLTVTAKSRGSATITVTASDGEAKVSNTFTVKVKAAPTVASALADISSLPEAELRTISPSGVFSDADGDTLTYTASSSDEDIAAAYMFFGDLVIIGATPGTVTITLTAQDSDGNQVSDSFTVTVTEEVNKAPIVASAISDVTITNTSGTKKISLLRTFNDPDADALTITAKTSANSVATASVASDGNSLTVTAKSRGTATITVTASDGELEVSDTFTVTVKAAPTVASALADISELAAGASREISLSGVFSDADGDALTLSAASSSNAVVTVVAQLDPVTASATAITVTAVSSGTATITVTARDSDGNQVSDAFDVTVPAAQQQQAITLPGPVIDLTLTAEGDKVVVSWTAPDLGSAPKGYIVHLKPEGGETGSGKTKRPKANKTKVTYNKLEAGVTYNVWVRAQNAFGKGERVHATITLPASQPEETAGPPGQ